MFVPLMVYPAISYPNIHLPSTFFSYLSTRYVAYYQLAKATLNYSHLLLVSLLPTAAENGRAASPQIKRVDLADWRAFHT